MDGDTAGNPLELLLPREMASADALAIAGGVPGIDLMEAAGRAVADAAAAIVPAGGHVLVACGPGNNGGDGFVAARLLREAGHRVTVLLAGDPARLKGDAAIAFQRLGGRILAPGQADPSRFAVIIDALLGAGLDRDLAGEMAGLVRAINASGARILAVDVPSGVDGATGMVRGEAVRAHRTETFFRLKPGHLLFPGRSLCGETSLADIGIPAAVLGEIRPAVWRNEPGLWLPAWPAWKADGHKYDRGHALAISGGFTSTGAARLAARAALRMGAGLVTLASPPDALAVNAAHLTAIMLRRMEGAAGLGEILSDRRINAIIMGPGLGIGEGTQGLVLAALGAGRATVLDADALTSFAKSPQALFDAIRANPAPTVLTPHGGEFARLFGSVTLAQGKLAAAREAARISGAIVVFKGADTVIAAPDGRAAINGNAPPWLGTAGAGDVLAGMICGLLACGMPGFEAVGDADHACLSIRSCKMSIKALEMQSPANLMSR